MTSCRRAAAPGRAPARRVDNATLLADGNVLIAGGSTRPSSAEIFDPSHRTILAGADVAVARVGASAVSTGGSLSSGMVTIGGDTASLAGINTSVSKWDLTSVTPSFQWELPVTDHHNSS